MLSGKMRQAHRIIGYGLNGMDSCLRTTTLKNTLTPLRYLSLSSRKTLNPTISSSLLTRTTLVPSLIHGSGHMAKLPFSLSGCFSRLASTLSSVAIIRRIQLAKLRQPFDVAQRTGEPECVAVSPEQYKALFEALLELPTYPQPSSSPPSLSGPEEIVEKYENATSLFSNKLTPERRRELFPAGPDNVLQRKAAAAAQESGSALSNEEKFERAQWSLLENVEVWDMYVRALAMVGRPNAGEKVVSATCRRAFLLDIPAPTAITESQADASTTASTLSAISPESLASAAAQWTHPDKVVKPAPVSSSPSGPGLSGGSFRAFSGYSGKPTDANTPAVRVIVEEAKVNVFYRILRFIGVTLVYGFIMLTILSLFIDSSGIMRAAAGSGGPSFQPVANDGKNRVTFEDVHGCAEAKEELSEIVEFLKDPTEFAKLGGRLPKGVLLTGPPGTGKTLLARAVAGEADVRFFSASGAEFDEMFVGVGAKRVRELFAAARKAGPAIIFIDELDAIGSKRSPRDYQHMKQTLNQLLVELDGFTQTEGIILIGATNVPQSLDKALTRPGRFDKHIAVPLPDVRGRLAILTHHAAKILYDKDTDLSVLARGTPGFSGAELQNLVNQAAVKASKDHDTVVHLSHFEWAKDKILMGAERKSAYITPESKTKTAYHEAGHALAAYYTHLPIHRVTCIPRGQALGLTQILPEMDRDSYTYTELRAQLDYAMGGRVAEEIIFGKENVTTGASSDIVTATRTATAMVRKYGFSDTLGPVYYPESDDEGGSMNNTSPETLAKIEFEIQKLVDDAAKRTMKLLTEKKVELERLKDALVEYETLDKNEITKVINGEKLDRKVI